MSTTHPMWPMVEAFCVGAGAILAVALLWSLLWLGQALYALREPTTREFARDVYGWLSGTRPLTSLTPGRPGPMIAKPAPVWYAAYVALREARYTLVS